MFAYDKFVNNRFTDLGELLEDIDNASACKSACDLDENCTVFHTANEEQAGFEFG